MTRAQKTLSLALGLLSVAALSTACPETLQQNCPSGTSTVGGFTLSFTVQDDAGDYCRVLYTADGGPAPADASVSGTPGPYAATLCTSAVDGGTIFLAISGQVVRQSPLDDAGAFTFTSSVTQLSGTQCSCPIDIAETFTGTLQSKAGGNAVFDADGGLGGVGGINASLVDAVTASPGDAGFCRCNLPCALRYAISGTPF